MVNNTYQLQQHIYRLLHRRCYPSSQRLSREPGYHRSKYSPR